MSTRHDLYPTNLVLIATRGQQRMVSVRASTQNNGPYVYRCNLFCLDPEVQGPRQVSSSYQYPQVDSPDFVPRRSKSLSRVSALDAFLLGAILTQPTLACETCAAVVLLRMNPSKNNHQEEKALASIPK